MIRLGVNVDHIATVRNARGEVYPSPLQAAHLAELGGASNITCHLREDRRHIRDRDVFALKDAIHVPLNFEMAATEEMETIALRVQPHAVTLVPEKRQELTTEGGLAMTARDPFLETMIERLKEAGILVSLFVEAHQQAIELAHTMGADAVEIHTGDFCHKVAEAKKSADQWALVEPFQTAAKEASARGLQVHFGHGLNYNNAHWLQAIPQCEEANIGHAIVARALFVGLTQAVHEMFNLLNDGKYAP